VPNQKFCQTQHTRIKILLKINEISENKYNIFTVLC